VDTYVKTCNEHLLKIARTMGYRVLVCEEIDGALLGKNSSLTPMLIKKVIIEAKNVSELRKTLAGINHKQQFITVHPFDKEAARWASHDGRVDSILLTTENINLFDKKQQNVMKYYSKPLEITLRTLISDNLDLRGVIYRRMRSYVSRKAPLIVSSMANKWYELYPPLSIVKFLLTQYDVPEKIGLQAITHVPWFIVSRKEVK
jgi:ribonuclease P/MRP protein subunit RPP1